MSPIRLLTLLRYVFAIFHAHLYRPNFVARCGNCRHWRFHSTRTIEAVDAAGKRAPSIEHFGVCALDRPKLFIDYETGYALKAWHVRDWCPRHPLYSSRILPGETLEFNPGEANKANAGFNRIPSIEEALRLASVARAVPVEKPQDRPDSGISDPKAPE